MWLFANAFMDGGMGRQTHLLHSLTPLCKLLHTAGGPSICGGTGPARTTWTAGHETTQTASDGSGFAAVLTEKYTALWDYISNYDRAAKLVEIKPKLRYILVQLQNHKGCSLVEIHALRVSEWSVALCSFTGKQVIIWCFQCLKEAHFLICSQFGHLLCLFGLQHAPIIL